MKTVDILHGTDCCSLVLLEGAEPSALTHAVAAKFHLGHHPFYFTYQESDAIVPLSSSLPSGRTLILHVCSYSSYGYHHHHHHSHHGQRSHHTMVYDNEPSAPPPSLSRSDPASNSTSISMTDPLLAGSWKDYRPEPGRELPDTDRSVQMVGNDRQPFPSNDELDGLGKRLSEINEADGSKVEHSRATLIVPEYLGVSGSRVSMSSHEAHEAAMEATAAAIAESARTIDRFSRLTSELANERTLLAWIRTGLAAIRTVFPFYALIDATSSWGWRATVIAAQVAMMTVVMFAGVSGTLRYEKVKNALRLHDPPQEFGRVSVNWFNGLVGITYFAIAIGIYTMNWDS